MYAPFMFNTTESTIPYILFYDNGNQVVPTHWHKEIEFAYSIEGTSSILVNDHLYEIPEGEAILINGGDNHFYFSTKEHKRIVIIFDLSIIEGSKDYLEIRKKLVSSFNSNNKSTFLWSSEEKSRLKEILKRLEELNNYSDIMRNLCIRSCIFELLYLFSLPKNKANGNENISAYSNKSMKQLERIFSYIEENYKKPIMLDDIANEIGYDRAYFSRFFKKYTNTTFISYLQAYRISKAQYLLVSKPELSIGQVSEEVGFQSVKTFNRIFKELVNSSPLKFRKVNI